MTKLQKAAIKLLRDDDGQDLLEYGLLAAFLSVAAVASLVLVKSPLLSLLDDAIAALKSFVP